MVSNVPYRAHSLSTSFLWPDVRTQSSWNIEYGQVSHTIIKLLSTPKKPIVVNLESFLPPKLLPELLDLPSGRDILQGQGPAVKVLKHDGLEDYLVGIRWWVDSWCHRSCEENGVALLTIYLMTSFLLRQDAYLLYRK